METTGINFYRSVMTKKKERIKKEMDRAAYILVSSSFLLSVIIVMLFEVT
jgi:hypothetical protein